MTSPTNFVAVISIHYQQHVLCKSFVADVEVATTTTPDGLDERCKVGETMKIENGAHPSISFINGQPLPGFLTSMARVGPADRADTRLRIFSGTANPALAQTQGRESIGAKLVANQITEAGAHRVIACDLHSGQSMGYFDIPIDHVYGQPVILDYLASKTICSNDLVVVSPDVGGVARARAFAKKLSDAPLAIVDKRRHEHNVAEVMNLIGDVRGKVAVMVDDMIDTAGTIAKGAELLHQEGAREVYACTTHGVFSPPAIERLSSGLFQEVIITNTIPMSEQNYFPQLTVLSVANLLGETIWRVHDDCSVSSIFQ
ncbi:Ribose-phosphate pyrophosphokinase 1 [Acorus calamus]|uniref:ribose-phosphate diphosphokinase n=1 Tax=Acorus calamus TaxID=4465 RepID=A0AAV9FEY5_ACOCL|nr:Ribose-phosphate pyrophosphokinase 1 [Acorus calamus]